MGPDSAQVQTDSVASAVYLSQSIKLQFCQGLISDGLKHHPFISAIHFSMLSTASPTY